MTDFVPAELLGFNGIAHQLVIRVLIHIKSRSIERKLYTGDAKRSH